MKDGFYLPDTKKEGGILVIGDLMIDEYIGGDVFRVSPEAPVPVVLKRQNTYMLGGAGNVAKNITSIDVGCGILSVCGNDGGHEILSNLLSESSIETVGLIKDPTRTTTIKTRVIGNNHQIVRIDSEDSHNINVEVEKSIIDSFEANIGGYSVVILQDYNKGLLTERVIRHVIDRCTSLGIKVFVDPKLDNIDLYRGSHLLKPNLKEFLDMNKIPADVKIDQEKIIEIAKEWLIKNDVDSMVVTLSGKGMIRVNSDGSYYRENGYDINVSDVSGAGDTVIALLSSCEYLGIDSSISLRASNLAGSIVCQYMGSTPIDKRDLLNTYSSIFPV